MAEEQKAAANIQCEEFYFDSADGVSSIHALHWLPAAGFEGPLGIVQIAHGMVEHIERYSDFARFLALQGFAVCGNSHVGHGKSAASPKDCGILPENGAQVMLDDIHSLRCRISARYPEGTPYFLFGHSMGSFVSRVYLARHGQGLAGCIICGTGEQPVAASKFAGALSRNIGSRKGFQTRSPLVHKLAIGSYAKAVPNARTNFDWLNTDPAKVEEYLADPLCGAMFSVGGYASLTDLTAEAATRACVQAVPAGLPVLFIAGGEDPVGNGGKAVQAAARAMMAHSGARVGLIIYEGLRHEILNEPKSGMVYADVLQFLKDCIAEGGER